MSAAVGIVTAAVMWLTGVGEPILWGTIAFLLNFVQILGPLLGTLIFLLAGALVGDTLWLALLPAGLYLGIHLVEGVTVTPMLAPSYGNVHYRRCTLHSFRIDGGPR